MDNRDVAKGWFRKASNDRRNAEYVITMENPPTDTICFHCQQSAEKYFKGFLALFGKETPKTHDLEELISICASIDPAFASLRDMASELTDYAITVRYPVMGEEIPVEDAKDAIKKARAIERFVLDRAPRS